MGRKYQVISGDGHLETPPDFVAFLPEKYKDRATIEKPQGMDRQHGARSDRGTRR